MSRDIWIKLANRNAMLKNDFVVHFLDIEIYPLTIKQTGINFVM